MATKSIDEVTQIIEKRGWNLYEKDVPKRSRRRTVYEKAVEDLESSTEQVSKHLQDTSDPKALLDQIIALQNHLDSRFAAKKGRIPSAKYRANHALEWLANSFSHKSSMYMKTDVELITEQRSITKLLLDQFGKSKNDMRKSYDLLEEYRLETARDLQSQTRKYVRVEKALGKLEQDETTLKEKMSVTTAASDDYAQLLHATGNVKLERQRLVNEHERVAYAIRSSKIGLEEVADYELVISESEQVLEDASASLKQVSTQQAIAQAVLSAFVEGEASMNAAYQVMETLSSNIATTHRTISGAFDTLSRLAVQLSTRKTTADVTTDSSRGLYGSLRGSRTPLTQDVHQYVKELFEKPVLEVPASGKNGHYNVEELVN